MNRHPHSRKPSVNAPTATGGGPPGLLGFTATFAEAVFVRTTHSNRAELARMSDLWESWLLSFESLDEHDALWHTLLDAADEMQACIFTASHGFYRIAAMCLRNTVEWLLASVRSSVLQLGDKPSYAAVSRVCGDLHRRFITQENLLSSAAGATVFGKRGWTTSLYDALCKSAHPYLSSSAAATWNGSNGPIYRSASFKRAYSLYAETWALGCLFIKLSKPTLQLPASVQPLLNDTAYRCLTPVGQRLAARAHVVLDGRGDVSAGRIPAGQQTQ